MTSTNFKSWAKAAAIRVARTVAQSILASIGATTYLGGVDWKMVASTAILAGICSFLTAVLVGLPEVETE